MSKVAPPTPASGPLDEFLCFSVYAAGLAFNRVYKPLLDRYGITYPQYLVLVALRGRDGQTVGELGGKLYLESNTLTPLVKRLEAAGLVSRTRDKQDERIVRVGLTEAGTKLTEEALGCIPGEILEATGMGTEELSALNDEIRSLVSALRNGASSES